MARNENPFRFSDGILPFNEDHRPKRLLEGSVDPLGVHAPLDEARRARGGLVVGRAVFYHKLNGLVFLVKDLVVYDH